MSEGGRYEVADVVIIGAGIVGAAAAWALSGEGLDVCILDRSSVNREGSGSTAGNLHIQAIHAERPGQMVPVDVGRFLPLQKAASDLWDEVSQELDHDIGLRRTGGLTVAETDAELETLLAKRELELAQGIPTEILRGQDLRTFAPELSPDIEAATWCPWDGYANPLQVTTAFLSGAAERGARISAFREVTHLRRSGTTWTVGTDDGGIAAPVVINAAGPGVPAITAMAGVHLDATTAPLQMHITVRVPPMLPRLVQHIGQGLSVKQVTAGQILIGGGWPAAADRNMESRYLVDVASVTGNLDLACRVLPGLANIPLLRVWGGPVLATADEMPIIGEVDDRPGFFVCGGTYAFTLAPLWAETLRCLVVGKPTPVPVDDLTPNRIVAAGSPPQFVKTREEGSTWRP